MSQIFPFTSDFFAKFWCPYSHERAVDGDLVDKGRASKINVLKQTGFTDRVIRALARERS